MLTSMHTNPNDERDVQRLMDLRRQREIVCRWVSIRSLPTVLLQELQAMLGDVDQQLEDLETRLRS
jgi:hypothetical protein